MSYHAEIRHGTPHNAVALGYQRTGRVCGATEVLAAERQLGEARLLRVRAGTQALLEDARLQRALGDPLYD